jgi:Arf-GAP/coiled-coil/ANK repeat/PH domain-containing protein
MLGDKFTDVFIPIPASCNIFSNSDQESTSGEEDMLGNKKINKILLKFTHFFIRFHLDEEDIEKLNPNYVLFKASIAHNLPVMCQAICLGADKNWQNTDNLNRTPLHEAVIIVIAFH